MNVFAKIGKQRTILISISILLVSLYTIYFNQSVRPEMEVKMLSKQIIRFLFTIGLLYLIYIGKNWARILIIILFLIANIVAIISLFSIDTTVINKTPIIVMIIVYTAAIYHFSISKSFKAFFEYQNNKDTEVI